MKASGKIDPCDFKLYEGGCEHGKCDRDCMRKYERTLILGICRSNTCFCRLPGCDQLF